MKWATWEHAGVDRMGCIWLIRGTLVQDAQYAQLAAEAK